MCVKKMDEKKYIKLMKDLLVDKFRLEGYRKNINSKLKRVNKEIVQLNRMLIQDD